MDQDVFMKECGSSVVVITNEYLTVVDGNGSTSTGKVLFMMWGIIDLPY